MSMSSTSSGSRKRARLDDLQQGSHAPLPFTGAHSESADAKDCVRDDTYYYSDGSCVLRIQNVLFHVHRTILSQDNSFFNTMFALPLPSGGLAEGASDENPIILTGDTVAEFKNFLWALYALPYELQAVYWPEADLPKLMDIAHVSNKYQFRSLEAWALNAVNDFIARKTSPLFAAEPYEAAPDGANAGDAAPSPTGALVARLVRLAQTCGHARLLHTMMALLTEHSIQWAFFSIALADELGLRALSGAAYARILQTMASVPSAPTADADVPRPFVASPALQQRLLSGYYRLSLEWEYLRKNPVRIVHAPTCGGAVRHQCMRGWIKFWKERSKSDAVLVLGAADVVGRLKEMVAVFEVAMVKLAAANNGMHVNCCHVARQMVAEKIKEFEESLPDYFQEGYALEL